MSAATVSRWTRRFVAVGIGWFVCWHVAVALGVPRRLAVVFGLYGFVFHVIFGRAYTLVPAYFDRELVVPATPALHLVCAASGTGLMAIGATSLATVERAGMAVWTVGFGVFLVSIGWILRDNLSGRETGTAAAKSDRRAIDRYANVFIPIAFLYLLAGVTLSVSSSIGVMSVRPAGGPPVTHLLAAAGVTLLLFAIGFRLLPRFLACVMQGAKPPSQRAPTEWEARAGRGYSARHRFHFHCTAWPYYLGDRTE